MANAAHLATQFAPPSEHKLIRSLRARRDLVERIVGVATKVRDRARPLVWMHAPSVGEGLQARPVAHALHAQHPDWQLAYTFFSPSAEKFASSVGADITEYLPFDRASDADAILDTIAPTVLVFSKLDVWPVLVDRAAARGIPVALISGTLAETSGRRGWWSRQMLHDAYATLAAVGAIDAEHAERLIDLGVRRDVVTVTGDTRFDQVAARADAVDISSDLLIRLKSSRPTVVAGSTWPTDERVIADAWPVVSASGEPVRLIIAPHETTTAHCASIEAWAQRASLSIARLSRLEASRDVALPDVVLVDRMGVLGDLYALADVAFVGGGFHAAGLHSVIEPAAFGAPVLFGPGHSMSREAGLLLAAGGARSVANSDELRAQFTAWFGDNAARGAAGAAARQLVQHERGATNRSVLLIESLMSASPR